MKTQRKLKKIKKEIMNQKTKMKKLTWKNWGYLGLVFLVLGLFIPTLIGGVVICWFIMSYQYYKEKKKTKHI